MCMCVCELFTAKTQKNLLQVIKMIMGGRFLHLIAYLFLLCVGRTTGSGFNGTANSEVQCIESEKAALLKFKQGFNNPSSGIFASWVLEEEEDCCKWRGVGCNNSTPGHVISLNLSGNGQRGEYLSHSLLDLPYLSSLDLSQNNFLQTQIPDFIDALSHLEHLNLSNSNFKGRIPDHLGNLSRLHSLDLSTEPFSPLQANNLNWLHGLSSLEFLDLSGVDLSSSSVNWYDSINMLPSLVKLHLSACRLRKFHHPSLPYTVNFTSLEILDLSYNNFSSSIPPWLFNISRSLSSVNLSGSQLQGLIPYAFGNMTSLAVLDLSNNNLEGEIPTSLGLNIQAKNELKLSSSGLRELYLSQNHLNGSLDQILPQLSQLVVLRVAYNLLEGTISETHLLNFSNLQVLDLSSTSLKFNISSSWIPPFQLHEIDLWRCQLGPRFPEWLQSQKYLLYLDIGESNISDTVPHWFWNLSDNMEYVDLSSNQLRGKLPPDFSSKANLRALNLGDNNFDGPLPRFSPNLVLLYLFSNSFSGPISSICEILVLNSRMLFLNLYSNAFSGNIPDCWTYGEKLVDLSLGDNNLFGKIPNSIGHLFHLQILDLSHNNLSGVIPSSLKNCNSLLALDFTDNKLSGNLPEWIGNEVQKLIFLYLGYNAFGGDIPPQLCQLKSLKALNLSHNNLSGAIPHCLDNLLAFRNLKDVPQFVEPNNIYSNVDNMLDLSYNKLSGEIPRKITSLTQLISLNLSSNRLNGTIPDGIGDITYLQFLDLSRNELSCTIPPTLSNLSSLESLNLSFNRLSGKIPKLNRSKNFDGSCFMENHKLCGYPLANDCSFNGNYEDPDCREKERNENNYVGSQYEDDGGDDDIFLQIPAFYFSMGLGFIVGFWVFWGTLLVKDSWRHVYFQFLGNLYDQVFVLVVVYWTKLRRRFQNNLAAE